MTAGVDRVKRARRELRRIRPLYDRVKDSPALTAGARRRMLVACVRAGLGLTGVRDTRVPVPGGSVFLGRRTTEIDIITFLDVWEVIMFDADCADRVVLDIGAHKGYFGAWALHRGASLVISYEPEDSNHAGLVKAQRASGRAAAWRVERLAVGDREGVVTLFVSDESWAHTLHEGLIDAVGTESVRMVPFTDVLASAASLRPGVPIVLKLNAEGAAGQILLPVAAELLASVVEVHLDHEPGSPYDLQAIFDHLAAAGLDDVEARSSRLFRIRRSDAVSG